MRCWKELLSVWEGSSCLLILLSIGTARCPWLSWLPLVQHMKCMRHVRLPMTCNQQQLQVNYVNLYLTACVDLGNTA